ncbi:hypothetical protein OIHEL45_04310 [Sulfitobacter indolifex HEL-45]|uniref:Uncharacterized protein n=1 Tax=Sulfitobacter indolifex HEL-45 TaxID=391624 RepID=A0ABM9X9G0_9RHOB|nr:hypothetical protein OIHEL45_04310 [Sulfitobacter indolifex HEL-45]
MIFLSVGAVAGGAANPEFWSGQVMQLTCVSCAS